MFHHMFYKHTKIKMNGVGSIVTCMRRLFARNLDVTIYPDNEYGNYYVIHDVGREDFTKLMESKSPSDLVRIYLEITDERIKDGLERKN